MTHWFCLRTASRQERRSQSALTEKGIMAYCPLITRWERIGRMKLRDKRQAPYFDGYIFAIVPDGQFAHVESIVGPGAVLRYTTASGIRTPRPIPAGLVEALQHAELRGDFDKTRQANTAQLEPGDRVRVTAAGPFEGLLGQIKECRGSDRVKVLMDAIQRGAPVKAVEIDVGRLEAVA